MKFKRDVSVKFLERVTRDVGGASFSNPLVLSTSLNDKSVTSSPFLRNVFIGARYVYSHTDTHTCTHTLTTRCLSRLILRTLKSAAPFRPPRSLGAIQIFQSSLLFRAFPSSSSSSSPFRCHARSFARCVHGR